MWTFKVNDALAPAFSVAIEHWTVPTTGLVQRKVGPEFCVIETKVILPGKTSVSLKFWAAFGPPLATVIRNSTSVSGAVAAGPLFVALRSASSAPGVVTT